MSHWPFWMGGTALAGVAVGYLLLLRRPFGVSGMISVALDGGARRAEAENGPAPDLAEVEALLADATTRHFGADAGGASAAGPSGCAALPQDALGGPDPATGLGPRLAWSTNVLFLVGIVAGAALSALLAGQRLTWDPGPVFSALIGRGAAGHVALFMGGALVGFGTRLAGGCTSGHGLSGCARLQPGSLVSTACFFGLGIVLSLILAAVAR
jgi:uncharacterized membrane protein YedE/YeeE